MTLDNYIGGDFDSLNPSNQEPAFEDFESDNIQECLDYAKEFEDFEPLENAIENQVQVIEKAIEELQLCVDSIKHTDRVWLQNRLIRIKIELLKNQKK